MKDRRMSGVKKIIGMVGCCLLCFQVGMAAPTRLLEQVDDSVACRNWVEHVLSSLTLKQKIGQLFVHKVAPVTSRSVKDNIRRAVKEYGIGGLLFSGGELEKQVELTNFAQELAGVPLMVTFDGEWGLAMRLKGTPSFPRNRVLGCIQNDSLIYAYGREVARQLREIGVHVNFAPVADIDNNPNNPVINTRAFGSRRENVARKVRAYAQGLEDGGVLAVCKHFPGHGDTDVDSHRALPVLGFNRERLDSLELYPFREAVYSGISGVMVGHLQVPCLDKKPASISQKVVNGLLKKELGFTGLTFTDALEMKGVSNQPDVCAQALIAGNDLLLPSANLRRNMDGVLRAVRSGRLSEEEITARCRKVLTYKYALGLADYHPVKLDGLMERVHTPQTDSLLLELDEAAVTVLQDTADLLPLDLSLSGNVLLTFSKTLSEMHPFYQELREKLPLLSWVHATPDSLKTVEARLRPAQRVIVAVNQKNIRPYAALLKALAQDKPVVIVCFQPQSAWAREAEVFKAASTVVLAHTSHAALQRKVAGLLLGTERASGRLSVGIRSAWPEGTGVAIDPDCPRSYVPEDFGMNSEVLNRIDTLAMEGIAEKAYPGCQILILKEGYPVYQKCFGTYTYNGNSEVRPNSVYDLASLSKAAGTLLAVMKLYDEGKLTLTDQLSTFLPATRGTDKANLTIQELLYHESGLPSYLPFYMDALDLSRCKRGLFRRKRDATHTIPVARNLYACSSVVYKPEWVSAVRDSVYTIGLTDSLFLNKDYPRLMLDKIMDTPLKSKSYRYSCLNFMLLKEVVEVLAEMPMDKYLDSVFYRPMGLTQTTYLPLRKMDKEEIVPTVETDFLRGRIQGRVHDEAAAFMGGVSGNAGLFSTAREVGVIFQMILDHGICGDRRYLSRATCDLFMGMKSKNSRRGLGFDKPDVEDPMKSPCTEEAPASVFGHTGFTGTCAWADPDNQLVFVFLCNRIYPQAYGSTKLMHLNLRTRMQQAMYQSLMK